MDKSSVGVIGAFIAFVLVCFGFSENMTEGLLITKSIYFSAAAIILVFSLSLIAKENESVTCSKEKGEKEDPNEK